MCLWRQQAVNRPTGSETHPLLVTCCQPLTTSQSNTSERGRGANTSAFTLDHSESFTCKLMWWDQKFSLCWQEFLQYLIQKWWKDQKLELIPVSESNISVKNRTDVVGWFHTSEWLPLCSFMCLHVLETRKHTKSSNPQLHKVMDVADLHHYSKSST